MADTEAQELQAKCNKQALQHLLKFEAAIVATFRAGAAFPMGRTMIGEEARSATVLAGLPSLWRSRPQALLAIAEQVRILHGRREITQEDVNCMMSAVEASWELDPDVTLGANGGEQREPFDLWMEELTERAAR